MTINEAYIFCEKVANKDQQGLLGPATFNAFAPAAQLDAILVRAPFYGSEQGITDELLPVVNSVTITVSSTGLVPKTDYPGYIRALSLFGAGSDGSMLNEADLLPLDQFRKRATSESRVPSLEFPIAGMNKAGMEIRPKLIGKVIFDYIESPTSPRWAFTGTANDPVYDPTNSVNFVLPDSTHVELCARVLVYAGLHLSNTQLENWGLTRASITSPKVNG